MTLHRWTLEHTTHCSPQLQALVKMNGTVTLLMVGLLMMSVPQGMGQVWGRMLHFWFLNIFWDFKRLCRHGKLHADNCTNTPTFRQSQPYHHLGLFKTSAVTSILFSNSCNRKIVLRIIYYNCVLWIKCSSLTEVVLSNKDVLTLFSSPCTHSGLSLATKGSK